MTGSSAPDIPLQEVQASATTPNPSFSRSVIKPASSRYMVTAFDPGASDDFTHGLRVRPRRFALRANRAAAITLRGLEVPAILRTTVDKSNFSTRSYSALTKVSDHKPAVFA